MKRYKNVHAPKLRMAFVVKLQTILIGFMLFSLRRNKQGARYFDVSKFRKALIEGFVCRTKL